MRFLSGKEKKGLSGKLPSGFEVSKKDEVVEKDSILWKNKEPFLVMIDDEFFPHLKSVEAENFKAVFVDRGAIPFVLKGADLMRPGISVVDSGFSKDEIILIRDEEHKKVIAIGVAMFDSEELESMEKGKVVKVVHFVSDVYYSAEL